MNRSRDIVTDKKKMDTTETGMQKGDGSAINP